MEITGTQSSKVVTARDMGLVGCTRCARVNPPGLARCPDCGNPLKSRDRKALQRVWAFWMTGLFFYFPANLLPMLETHTLVSDYSSTIVGGAIELWQHDSKAVALVILVASVLIPISKFLAIGFLAISVERHSHISSNQRLLMYEIIEYIGRWSMVDVFVVAILAGLVQLKAFVSITPGPASLFFALSVILTMLAAQSFDTRAIWDSQEDPKD